MADVSKHSGGTDLSGEAVTVGADVVGRDKIVQPTTYNYYGALPAQPRRAALPHQPYFFGREDELAIIAEALDPESNGWGVLIDGPSGIGKTALAIESAHRAPAADFDTKVVGMIGCCLVRRRSTIVKGSPTLLATCRIWQPPRPY